MTFEFVDIEEPESMHKIVDILNGTLQKSLPEITVEYPFIMCKGMKMLEIRGKGILTTKYGLEENYTVQMQKRFLNFCAGKLSGISMFFQN
jgi:hypothetical protein